MSTYVPSEGASGQCFRVGDRRSKWYRNLAPKGDCQKLFGLLKEKPARLLETGEGNVTVLHKAVRHGYTKLVEHILVEMFDDSGFFRHGGISITREDLLCETDDNKITAVMVAIMVGNHDVVRLLHEAILLCDKEYDSDTDEFDGGRDIFEPYLLEMPQASGSVFSEAPENIRIDTPAPSADENEGGDVQPDNLPHLSSTCSISEPGYITPAVQDPGSSSREIFPTAIESEGEAMSPDITVHYSNKDQLYSNGGKIDTTLDSTAISNNGYNEVEVVETGHDQQSTFPHLSTIPSTLESVEGHVTLAVEDSCSSTRSCLPICREEISSDVTMNIESTKDDGHGRTCDSTVMGSGISNTNGSNRFEAQEFLKSDMWTRAGADENEVVESGHEQPNTIPHLSCTIPTSGESVQDNPSRRATASVAGHREDQDDGDWVTICNIMKRILDDRSIDGIQDLRKGCMKHVDFNFVAPEEIFFHYLLSMSTDSPFSRLKNDTWRVTQIIKSEVLGSGERGKILYSKLLTRYDPQGRTPLHVAWHYEDIVPEGEEYEDCWNARDAAGRTLLHYMIMMRKTWLLMKTMSEKRGSGRAVLDRNARVKPTKYKELRTLLNWQLPYDRYPNKYNPSFHCTPLHLAVLYDWGVEDLLSEQDGGETIDCNPRLLGRCDNDAHFVWTPLQMAACLGRTECLGLLLKVNPTPPALGYHCMGWSFVVSLIGMFEWGQLIQRTSFHDAHGSIGPTIILIDLQRFKDKRVFDYGFLEPYKREEAEFWIPSLHCAAFMGQIECVRLILKDANYDPLVKSSMQEDSALHCAVDVNYLNSKTSRAFDLVHVVDVLPDDGYTMQLFKSHLQRRLDNIKVDKFGYGGDAIACINLLLQAGIDIWTTNDDGDEPYPGPFATEDATKWWYDKVTSEVMEVKKNLGDASNATSVIAALVATASFIGPLQPPLGLTGLDGLVQSNRLSLRLYLASNGLSFYLSITSLLMSVIPSLPMPKQSMQEELRRSQRSLRVASFLLSVSIICILVSFSVANIVIVPEDWSKREFMVLTIISGGLACLFVLFLFFLRLIRLTFHRNEGVRWFYNKYVKL